jgi:hypothetical protein
MNLINNRHKHNGTPIISSPFPAAAYCATPGNMSSGIQHKTRSKNGFFVAVPETKEEDAIFMESFFGSDNDSEFDDRLLKRA